MMEKQTAAMDSAGVIEVLNRSGQLVQRLSIGSETVRLGRAYDNDLIVGDPYVCPHHLELRLEGGQLLVIDLDSVNGTYRGSRKNRIKSTHLPEGVTIHFGHSRLRYHASGSKVPKTWRDTARHGLLAVMGKPWLLVLGGLLAVASLLAQDLLDNPAQPQALTMASDLLYPLIGILAWAGFWALLSRVVMHRSNFHVHLAISFLAVAGLFCSGQLVTLLGFAMGWSRATPWLEVLGLTLVAFVAIYAHLRYALHGEVFRQTGVAALAAIILFGTPVAGQLIDRSEFSSLPYLEPLLRPPAYRLVEGQQLEGFFQDAEQLRLRADKAASEP
jgi:hypothetical protein